MRSPSDKVLLSPQCLSQNFRVPPLTNILVAGHSGNERAFANACAEHLVECRFSIRFDFLIFHQVSDVLRDD